MNDLTGNNVYWWRSLDDRVLDTRDKILFAAYQEIHCQGFQSASLSNILTRAGVTKGALYHHFPNKIELGYAVLDEVIAERIFLSFVKPLQACNNPIDGIIAQIENAGTAFSLTDIELGCPLTVIAQEMAPIDKGFRERLNKIYDLWHGSIAECFRHAQEMGQIRSDIDPETVAVMIVATMEGAIHAAKVSQDLNQLYRCGAGLTQYLQLIRLS